ncbi:hypothetical protein NF27_ER00020 [Candidatus Jidaibacter acanthamoeba]|uniref:PPM-type phosphatase domain-containing protein n=1 Tax=Candidatus Jidaibacter acanthamoebae TaxID=86105 RepID=A0A0C1QI32_9RICK|nr:hypothetical protein [Candidatus Jidaibacter acanthamoeba]KIE05159.1 hypothetical protein NF27_ER00020 [Candidatus Jidaibacter acanthamoeba]
MREDIRQFAPYEIGKILDIKDITLRKNIIIDILCNNGLVWQRSVEDIVLLERQFRQLKFLYGLVIYNAELLGKKISEFMDLAWESTVGIDDRLLSKNIQRMVSQEIKSKILNEGGPTILEITKSFLTYETERQKKLRAELTKRTDSFVKRIRNEDIKLIKIKDPQIPEGEEFIDRDGIYQGLEKNMIAYATGNNYRRSSSGSKYNKPEGRQEIYDAARVDLATIGSRKIIISSISDGHMHAMDEQQDRQIKEIANLGCKLGNRELTSIINKYWREVGINNEDKGKEKEKIVKRNYNFSPKLYKLATGNEEDLSKYEETYLHDIVKNVLIRMSNNQPKNNFEHAGLTTYAVCINGEKIIRITGFSIGDQMVVGYSPSQGFINIAPSIRLTGGPDYWNHIRSEIENDEVPFLTFDRLLPLDTIIISLTDGIFDMLSEGCLMQEELGSFESFGKPKPSVYVESINIEEMNKLCRTNLSSVEEVKNWLLDIVKETIKNKEDSKAEDKAIEIGDDTTIIAINVREVIGKSNSLLRWSQREIVDNKLRGKEFGFV